MAFITRTRILQFAEMVGGVPTLLVTPTVFRTGPQGTVVLSMAEAMAIVPAGQRPPEAEWGNYVLEYLVDCYFRPTVKGVVPDTDRLVFDADFWVNQASQIAGDPPLRRNTNIFSVGKAANQEDDGGTIKDRLIASLYYYLMRAEFLNFPADNRDPSVVTTTDPAHDPQHLLTKPKIVNANGAFIDIQAQWRPY